MTGKYYEYPEYKSSDVRWLGQIPSHWYEAPLKHVASFNDEVLSETTNPDIEIQYIDIGSVSSTEGVQKTEEMKFGAAPSRARRLVKNGDVIVSTVRTYLEAIAPITAEHEGMVASTGFAVIRPVKVDSAFAQYSLRARHFIDEVVARSTGVSYPAINSTDLVRIGVIVPPLDEQKTIAAFLDHETAKIDTLIDKQQQLIQLLKEKRQAVISHAVTKGLDPNVPMKDSGVEWLGEVPEHWEVTYLNHLVDPKRKIMYGIVLPGVNVDIGVPIVKGGDVKPGRLNLDSLCKTTFEIEAKYERSRLREGDLVYSIRGTIGDVQIVPKEIEGANLTQDAARIAPLAEIQNTWLFYVMESQPIFSQLEIGSLGAAVKGINIRDLKKACIPVPSKEDRAAIASYLDSTLGKLDRIEEKASSQVLLLKERRTALISAAVTGKIDVRNWQPSDSNIRMEATA